MVSNDDKLMILSMPKTASTSLLDTLIYYTRIKGNQTFNLNVNLPSNNRLFEKKVLKFQERILNKFLSITHSNFRFYLKRLNKDFHNIKLKHFSPANDFTVLSLFHSDICDINGYEEIFSKYVLTNKIHKQHFPPTESNKNFLAKNFNLFLLKREPAQIIEAYKRVLKEKNNSLYQLLKTEELSGILCQELEKWLEGWTGVVPQENQFWKDEIVNNPKECIEKMIFSLKERNFVLPEKLELSKIRYTK